MLWWLQRFHYLNPTLVNLMFDSLLSVLKLSESFSQTVFLSSSAVTAVILGCWTDFVPGSKDTERWCELILSLCEFISSVLHQLSETPTGPTKHFLSDSKHYIGLEDVTSQTKSGAKVNTESFLSSFLHWCSTKTPDQFFSLWVRFCLKSSLSLTGKEQQESTTGSAATPMRSRSPFSLCRCLKTLGRALHTVFHQSQIPGKRGTKGIAMGSTYRHHDITTSILPSAFKFTLLLWQWLAQIQF